MGKTNGFVIADEFGEWDFSWINWTGELTSLL